MDLGANVALAMMDAYMRYEKVQAQKSMGLNDEIEEISDKLAILNEALTKIKNRETDENDKLSPEKIEEITAHIKKVQEAFPELLPENFVEEMKDYADEDWDRIEANISNQERLSTNQLNRPMTKLEQIFSDNTKVHEIMSEFLKEVREFVRSINRRTGVR